MYWQGAAALLLGASTYITQAAAQVITITQYPSTCSAIYTSGSRSVTIVQSTVTVSPVPWDDDMANGGTPFVLQALPDTTGQTRRQASAPRWVLPNGYLTTDGSQAARYIIMNDQLTTATGGWVSTFEGIPYGTFVVATNVGNLNTSFRVTDGKLVWSNEAFSDGVARLFQTSDGSQDPPHIVARFYGAINNDWIPYSLYARPVDAAIEGSSQLPGMSSTSMVSSVGGGMSSMQPPVSTSPSGPYQTPSYTYQPTTGGQGAQSSAGSSGESAPTSQGEEPSGYPSQSPGGNTPSSQDGQPSGYPSSNMLSSQVGQSTPTGGQGNQPSSSAAQSSPPTPSPTGPISSDGFCGGDTGFICAAPQCCGQYGYCGNAVAYCGDGCQPGFGYCWSSTSSAPAATSNIVPTSYPPGISIPSSMSMTLPASTPQSSLWTPSVAPSPTMSYQPAPTYARCPDDDMEIITDGYGMQYTIGCSRDTTSGMYASDTVARGFNECFQLCDETPDCTAFTYLGSVDGVGPGICYFKDVQVEFVDVDNGDRYVGAIRVMTPSGVASSAAASTSTGPTYSTYTATATPIGPDNPGGPKSRTSGSSPANSGMSSRVSTQPPTSSTGVVATSTPSSSQVFVLTSSSSQMMAASSTSSSPAAAATSLCPGADGTTYSDPAGTEYTIMCGRDFTPGSFKILPFDSLSACINACIDQTEQVCVGVTFGGGRCYFKAYFDSFSLSSGVDSAVLVSVIPGNPPEYSSSSMAMVSSPSSTMAMSSSSSSAMAMMSSSSSTMPMMSSSTSRSMSALASTSTSRGPSSTSTSSATPSATRPVSPNGHCGTQGNGGTPEGFTCRNSLFGDCCSLSGFCGYSSDYCLAGCQTSYGDCTPQGGNPITESGECGPDWSNHTCTGGIYGPCCSTSGFCGSDGDYCGPGNCINGFGICDPDPSTTMIRSSTSSSRPVTTTTTSTRSSSSPAITTTTTKTTTTTTSTTSSSTSSSPYLSIPSPTSCYFGDPIGYDEDDSYCRITLPFPMRIYTQSDANTFASTNGYLSITYGSSLYASQQFPASNIPNNTVAPFFDDLYLDSSESPKQGIFYQVQGTTVTYEWYLGRGGVPGNIYHWTVRYDSAVPGVFTYTYYSTGGPTDQGEYASVGSQGKDGAGAAIGTTYAYHVQTIAPGLVVVCDTNANTCVTQT